MFRIILFALLASVLTSTTLYAKDQKARERGVLTEMQSISCGTMQKTGSTVAGVLITGAQHTKSRELLCQEYVLKTSRVTYRIRPKEEKHPVLLRVGDEAEFRLKKDEMLLRIPETDNKEREYTVVSMTASPEFSSELNGTQPPPKPHGVKLDANASEHESAAVVSATGPQPTLAAVNAPPQAPQETASVSPSLKIDSNPSGADVFIDSSLAGRTPALVPIKAGQHTVQVVMSGYKDWTGTVTAVPGSQQITATLTK